MSKAEHLHDVQAGSAPGLDRHRDLGEGVARLRAERAISVAGMARRLGVSRDTVYKIEQGNLSVAMGTVMRYLEALGIDGAAGLTDAVRGGQGANAVGHVRNSMFPPDVVRQAVVKFRA